jgi:hypothetical protein
MRYGMMSRSLVAVTISGLAWASALGGDLPSRYAPPPVIGGGPGTKVGVLNCRFAPSVGLLVVGFQKMDCLFTSDGPAPPERYVGTMTTVGLDVGFTASGALTWGVYASTRNLMPGSLAGNYGGASGSAAVGVGVGTNFLLGGSQNSIALQPWSVEGSSGVSASLGLSNMELRPAS